MTCQCEVCGLPSWATDSGVRIKLRLKAENSFRRDHSRTVWCCSRPCAVQAFAISKMGPASHRWPVSLADFETVHRHEIERALEGSDRTETPLETRINSGVEEANFEVALPPHQEEVSVRSQVVSARNGRPRKWGSEAQRLKAYRNRRRVEVSQ